MKRKMPIIVGIDWSREKHQVNLFTQRGDPIIRFEIDHTKKGFTQLTTKLSGFGLPADQIMIGIETNHNQLVDYLQAQGYVIYVIAPSVVKGNRSRQSHSGAKNDSKDADLIADILRTDRRRMIPWRPDDPLTRKIRYQLTLIDDLTQAISQGRNRLDAQLWRYFPQATNVFSDLTNKITLKMLIEYPTPSAVANLDLDTFRQFCQDNRYTRKKSIPERFVRLKRETPFDHEDAEFIYASSVPALARRLLHDVELKQQMIKELQLSFWEHEDASIFHSLPGAGDLLAPKMLSIFGDCRDRYPSPDMVRALAGTCPATSQSGKKRGVFFRFACNHAWRNAFQQFATSSVSASDWAATYFEESRLRGHKRSHAYRNLANRWVGIIWTLWQRRHSYDEAVHLQHRRFS